MKWSMEHKDSTERAAFNKFKRLFREAHSKVKRNKKYYNSVKAAYKAQNSTLDPWLKACNKRDDAYFGPRDFVWTVAAPPVSDVFTSKNSGNSLRVVATTDF